MLSVLEEQGPSAAPIAWTVSTFKAAVVRSRKRRQLRWMARQQSAMAMEQDVKFLPPRPNMQKGSLSSFSTAQGRHAPVFKGRRGPRSRPGEFKLISLRNLARSLDADGTGDEAPAGDARQEPRPSDIEFFTMPPAALDASQEIAGSGPSALPVWAAGLLPAHNEEASARGRPSPSEPVREPHHPSLGLGPVVPQQDLQQQQQQERQPIFDFPQPLNGFGGAFSFSQQQRHLMQHLQYQMQNRSQMPSPQQQQVQSAAPWLQQGFIPGSADRHRTTDSAASPIDVQRSRVEALIAAQSQIQPQFQPQSWIAQMAVLAAAHAAAMNLGREATPSAPLWGPLGTMLRALQQQRGFGGGEMSTGIRDAPSHVASGQDDVVLVGEVDGGGGAAADGLLPPWLLQKLAHTSPFAMGMLLERWMAGLDATSRTLVLSTWRYVERLRCF